jgi:SecD/SecF fusion protein
MSLPLRIALVVFVTLASCWLLFPAEKKLRKGKDLAGGVTLIYQIDVPPGESPGEVTSKVVDVLKNRVDPNGQLDISFLPQGSDRIEVTMPMPSVAVKKLRADFERTIEEISTSWMGEDDLDRLLRAPADEREQIIKSNAGSDAARAEDLRKACAAYDAAKAARASFEAAQVEIRSATGELEAMRAKPVNEQPTDEILFLEAKIKTLQATSEDQARAAAQADIDQEAARAKALQGGISPTELKRVLRLSDQGNRLVDDATKQSVEIPSPRSQAVERLRKEHPAAAAQIDKLLVARKTYESTRSTLDDPADLKRMISGAGVLNFRITVPLGALPEEAKLREAVRKSGPRAGRTDEVGWYKLNKIEGWYSKVQEAQALLANPAGFFASRGYVVEPYDGEYYMACWDKRGSRLTEAEGDWSVAGASESKDQIGRPAIGFHMDPLGAQKLGALTEANVNQCMAVLLDDQVYTAPRLNSRISSSGIIEGTFTRPELNYIIRVLAAGSLTAKLSPEPISESVVGPQLGADNLDKGFNAALISLVVCFVVMVGYYFFCGLIAFVAMCLNVVMVLATMAVNQSPLSVPAIAGVILTFAMSVDANVLIYERMREELRAGKDTKTSVRLGYQKAMSAIVDGNMMHLIVSSVLFFVGTAEIRGFAIAMVIGVVMTLFTQLFVTHVLCDVVLRSKKANLLRLMLPLQVPAIHRLFSTNIDWMGLRKYFYPLSAVAVVSAIVLTVFVEGRQMLSNEFLGGTAITLQFREAKPDEAAKLPKEAKGFVTLQRSEVEDRLHKLADRSTDPAIKQLRDADVLVLNPLSDGFTSSQFKIRTVITDAKAVRTAVIEAFGDVVDSQPQLTFKGSEATDPRQIPAYPVVSAVLGEDIDRPDVRTGVSDYIGGVAFVLDNLTPPTSVRNLEQRLAQARNAAGNESSVGRKSRVVVLQGTPEQATAAAVLVFDPDVSYTRDEMRWGAELKAQEWKRLQTALTQSTTLASVESFSPAIARSFAARAIMSILLSSLLIIIYVWVRYAHVGYAAAALLATLHDVVCALGLIALAEYLYDGSPRIASSLMLLPFKIDLTVVASLLTILGSSINDKIVCLDRIRENRGKLPYVSKELINTSLNQVFSRTIMTGWTVVLSLLVLYVYGGEAVRAFAYVLGLGFLIGIYSSIAIGAPLVYAFQGGKPGSKPESKLGEKAEDKLAGERRKFPAPAGAPSAA